MVMFNGKEGGWMDARLSGPPVIPALATWTEPYIYFQAFPTVEAPAPAALAPAPSIEPVLDNNVSVSVYGRVIPISAGKRRLPGDLIWLKNDQLNTEGQYTANAAYSFGYRLIEARANLVKVWANGVKIYDATAGFTAEGFTFVFYDGSQTAIDPVIAADKGAAITPAYKRQLYIRGVFPTKEFNGSLPNLSVLVEDEPSGFQQFLPWSNAATGETLDPAHKSPDIDLSNGNLTAERVTPDGHLRPQHWVGVRGTKGREANQPLGHGWFVFEAHNDHVTTIEDSGVVIFPMDYQGPGLAVEGFNLDGERAGNERSLYFSTLFGMKLNNTETGFDTLNMMEDSVPTMFAVRLDVMKIWKGVDSYFNWNDPDPPLFGAVGGSPVDNIGGVDISFLSGQGLIYPAWFGVIKFAKGTLNLGGGFFNTPPGWSSGGSVTAASTLTDIIVAVGVRCGLSFNDFRFVGLDNIKVTGIVIASDTDFLAFLKNAGRVYGYDYTESGGRILCRKAVIGTSYTVDIADIPEVALIPASNDGALTTTRDNSHRPEIIELKYQDETIDYQPSLQRARIPRVKSPQTDSFGIPFVMTAQEAITGAATALYREQFARVSHAFQLPFQYQRIEPTDLIEFTSSGKAYTVKITNVVRNSDLSVKVTAVNLLTAEAEPSSFTGSNYEEYRGGGFSGDANPGRTPLEIPPPIVITSLAFEVEENQTTAGALTATGGAPPYTWLLTGGGADASLFSLTSDGALTFVVAPDYELPTDADTDNVYLVEVQASSFGPRATVATVAVTVISEFPPIAITSESSFSILEANIAIAVLTATGGSGSYTWSIIGGADAASFTIGPSGGLSFAIPTDYEAPADADGDNVYLVQVQVSDGTRIASQNVAVTVTNAPEGFSGMDFSKPDNSGYLALLLEDI